MGSEELLRRLDRRLSFLTGGPRDLPLRQQTLRSTIAWSHDLLDQSEGRLFARLGVFAAGFSLEAAETVCADDAVPAVLDGIASLVDKSLVRTEDPLHGQPRFTMLQVVRDFSLEQLDAMEEMERLRRSHADYYLRVIIAAEPMLRRDPGPAVREGGRVDGHRDRCHRDLALAEGEHAEPKMCVRTFGSAERCLID